MSFFNAFLSAGAAMLERTMKTKPDYEEYTREMNAFVPWFPGK